MKNLFTFLFLLPFIFNTVFQVQGQVKSSLAIIPQPYSIKEGVGKVLINSKNDKSWRLNF